MKVSQTRAWFFGCIVLGSAAFAFVPLAHSARRRTVRRLTPATVTPPATPAMPRGDDPTLSRQPLNQHVSLTPNGGSVTLDGSRVPAFVSALAWRTEDGATHLYFSTNPVQCWTNLTERQRMVNLMAMGTCSGPCRSLMMEVQTNAVGSYPVVSLTTRATQVESIGRAMATATDTNARLQLANQLQQISSSPTMVLALMWFDGQKNYAELATAGTFTLTESSLARAKGSFVLQYQNTPATNAQGSPEVRGSFDLPLCQ